MVTDPATLDHIADVADLDASDTHAAIKAAQDAFPGWKARLAKVRSGLAPNRFATQVDKLSLSHLLAQQDRAAILNKWFELVMTNSDELARLMTEECGKPLTESKGEVAYGTWSFDGPRVSVTHRPSPSTPLTNVLALPFFAPMCHACRRVVPAVVCGGGEA